MTASWNHKPAGTCSEYWIVGSCGYQTWRIAIPQQTSHRLESNIDYGGVCVWNIWRDARLLLGFTAGGSGRSLGTATREDTHLIWWYRLARQSAYRPSQKPACRFFAILAISAQLPQSVNFFHLAMTLAIVSSHSFPGPFTDPFLSGIIGLSLHVGCFSTSEFAKIVLSKCVWKYLFRAATNYYYY